MTNFKSRDGPVVATWLACDARNWSLSYGGLNELHAQATGTPDVSAALAEIGNTYTRRAGFEKACS